MLQVRFNAIQAQPQAYQAGVPAARPTFDGTSALPLFGRKHRSLNDVLMTAPDGDIYPQFDAFPYEEISESELSRFLDYWA